MKFRIKKVCVGTVMACVIILFYHQNMLQYNKVTAVEKGTDSQTEPTLTGGEVTKKAFAPGQPHMVLILSYQRCGSSFFGGIFDQHPDGMYVFEPLDGLYNAMYGTTEGWSVPSDIMNWPNGTQRTIPREESRGIVKFLGDLMTCQYDNMPTEFFVHRYWDQFRDFERRFIPYVKCLKSAGVNNYHAKCFKYLSRKSIRFGEDYDRLSLNQAIMWDDKKSKAINHIHGPEHYRNYSECLMTTRIKANKCIRNVSQVCHGTQFRSVKTVRATMESVEDLINEHHNMRIIHLIRDPRAVVLSRKKYHSSVRSLYAGSDVIKEGKLFCQNLVKDIKIRKQLEAKYPGVFLEVLYDDFVLEPLNYTEKIYDFVDMNLPESVRNWVVKNTEEDRNSTYIANKWQKGLSYHEVKGITESCENFFNIMNHEFS